PPALCTCHPPLRLHALLPLPFPTRRSSDLDITDDGQRWKIGRPRSTHFCFLGADRRHLRDAVRALLEGPLDHLVHGILEKRPDLDRKSTRLNSSHGSNSYAVFCLKTTNGQA